jgi:caffeoyl-CoA O-methyltransferase
MPMTFRTRSRFIDEAAAAYSAAHSSGPDKLQLELQEVTEQQTGQAAGMQIGDDQAVLMEIIARAIGARRAVEVGTFTGYSALAVARGMGPKGRLLCCDISEEWTSIARQYWERAGVADRIELRLGPALDTLRALPPTEQFDLAFVDADKTGYGAYYDEILPRLRPGGLLLADNTLQSGRVMDTDVNDPSTEAIRAFNDRVAADPRVRVLLLPIGDGVSFVQKQ